MLSKKIKPTDLLLILLFSFLIFYLISYLNPLDNKFFDYHDNTQPARIKEFFLNLKNLKIPPRIAPNFYFGYSYPVFSFYAPATYWLASLPQFLGADPASATEVSFAVLVLTAFWGMYKLSRSFFGKAESFLSASVYITSPYIAVEIFIRGNLGELGVWATLPWSLWALRKKRFTSAVLFTSFLLTSHNILSLTILPFIILWAFLQYKKTSSAIPILSLVFSLLISLYFLLPALLEQKYIWAKEIASRTNYKDHFLCLSQLWNSQGWYFGGSIPGCQDTMSFKLGKLQILIFLAGIIFFFLNLAKKKVKTNLEPLLILALGIIAVFFTLDLSASIWKKLEIWIKVFQFPWRFLILSIFSLAFFSSYLVENLRKTPLIQILLTIFLVLSLFFINKKYFFKPLQDKDKFFSRYLSEDYINFVVVANIPEYLSRETNYQKVLSYLQDLKKEFKEKGEISNKQDIFFISSKNIKKTSSSKNPFLKKAEVKIPNRQKITLGLHYPQQWEIKVNNSLIIPEKFDDFGRILLELDQGEYLIQAEYRQTKLQITASLISFFSFLLLIALKILKYRK